MGTKSLVMLDTDHIKQYVFGTDKLKEIRGASSLLDRLNRVVMEQVACGDDIGAETIYANGGSGLFLVDTDKAALFATNVQGKYRELTSGGASITSVIQNLPKDAPEDVDAILEYDLENTLTLLSYKLREAKNCPPEVIALPSHPFMRLCDACGIEYAEGKDMTGDQDPDEEDKRYCNSCLMKRQEDANVKRRIKRILEEGKKLGNGYLWERLINQLTAEDYRIPPGTERPHDFNAFRGFAGAKEYLGLIYADANNMGKKIEDQHKLKDRKLFAEIVDGTIYEAMVVAIREHLKIEEPQSNLFPFDILLIGGDDIIMVTPAAKALDVAITIAKKFHEMTKEKDPRGEGHTLSVGVVLSPVKYPFGKQLDLVEETLRFAKKSSSDASKTHNTKYGATRINFMVVAGSTSQSFKKLVGSLHRNNIPVSRLNGRIQKAAFHATLRPYSVEQFELLLGAIRHGGGLGRTRLHQLREAILEMNLTTSVTQGLSVLRNWTRFQRDSILKEVTTFSEFMPTPQARNDLFERVTFPWFPSGSDYYTYLLDFVELYDFITKGEAIRDDEGGSYSVGLRAEV